MLSDKLYVIGKKHNLITKYNIEYNRNTVLDYACAIHISELLEEKYPLTDEQKNKLNVILSTLIVL